MHYYKRNLGDYAKKAGRLSMLQHGAYTLLIDACYDREQFPTLEEAIEWTWASSSVEIEAVEFVLRKFFIFDNGVYVQKRIAEEVAGYQEKAATNKRIALERESARRENGTNRVPDVHESPPNHKPITNNHKPITSTKHAFSAPSVADVVAYCKERGNGVDPQKFHDFYESKGWMVGKNKMKDWKASVRTWEGGSKQGGQEVADDDYSAWRKVGAEHGINPGSKESERDYIARVKRETGK